MGDDHAQPGTFEEALAAAFGERASDFSDDLKASLRVLYSRGQRDGRRGESEGALTYQLLKARRWGEDEEGIDPQYFVGVAEMMKKESER